MQPLYAAVAASRSQTLTLAVLGWPADGFWAGSHPTGKLKLPYPSRRNAGILRSGMSSTGILPVCAFDSMVVKHCCANAVRIPRHFWRLTMSVPTAPRIYNPGIRQALPAGAWRSLNLIPVSKPHIEKLLLSVPSSSWLP